MSSAFNERLDVTDGNELSFERNKKKVCHTEEIFYFAEKGLNVSIYLYAYQIKKKYAN